MTINKKIFNWAFLESIDVITKIICILLAQLGGWTPKQWRSRSENFPGETGTANDLSSGQNFLVTYSTARRSSLS